MNLVCCVCAFAGRGRPADAETIIHGFAVCITHASIVARVPDWDAIVGAVREMDSFR